MSKTNSLCLIIELLYFYIFVIFFFSILQKAKRSYQKDIANFREARDSHALPVDVQENGEESKYCKVAILLVFRN